MDAAAVDRARALAFAALGEAQPSLSDMGSGGVGSAESLTLMGQTYLPIRVVSGGGIVAYANLASQRIVSTPTMRRTLAKRNPKPPKALAQMVDRYGYMKVAVWFNRTRMHFRVSRLFVVASLALPHEAIKGLEADHVNGVKKDNSIQNLQLLTKADHTAKTVRTAADARRVARADSAHSVCTASSFGARPVVRTGKDGTTAYFKSATLAAASVGCSKSTISWACGKREAFGYMWRYSETPMIQTMLDAANAREAAARGTGWRDLVLPDGGGEKDTGYKMSFNLLVRTAEGEHILGTSAAGGRARAFNFRGTKYYTYVLGCSSFHGQRPFPGAVVKHAKDCYENVTVDMLSWGTTRQNNIEARGRAVTVTDEAGESLTFPCMTDAAASAGVNPNTLRGKLRGSCPQSVQVNGLTLTCGESRKRRREE